MKTARPEAARAVAAFRAAQNVFQEETIRRLADEPSFADSVTDTNLAFAKAFIVAVDTISLNLCWGPGVIDDVPLSNDKSETMILRIDKNGIITVDPWPFQRPEVKVSIVGKRLNAVSRDQADLDLHFATAPSVRNQFCMRKR